MTKTLDSPARPHGREDCELIRSGRGATYWQAADGLIVRLAADERLDDAQAAQRALLALACREAAGG